MLAEQQLAEKMQSATALIIEQNVLAYKVSREIHLLHADLVRLLMYVYKKFSDSFYFLKCMNA
jgi:hypothetical protein